MALKNLEIKWKTTLTSILEELTEPQFKKMLFDLDKIPQGVKHGKVREEIPHIIIQYFGTEGSISVIDKEMKQIPRMDAAVQDKLRPFVDKVKKRRQKNKGMTIKPATASGPVAKKEKPAAGMTTKPATASGPVAKKEKPADGMTTKPATASGPVAKKEKRADGMTTKPATASGPVAKKETPADGMTTKPATASGPVAKKEKPAADEQKSQPVQRKTISNPKATAGKAVQDSAQNPNQTKGKSDQVVPAKPKPRAAGSTQTSKVKGATTGVKKARE